MKSYFVVVRVLSMVEIQNKNVVTYFYFRDKTGHRDACKNRLL